jgi:pseudaminic acid cytidylyltransferase
MTIRAREASAHSDTVATVASVAIIPARGGSKRIPRKNVRPFHGKPVIAWSIEAAQSSGLFDEVMVSTDDAEIADVATQCGASVPFLRQPATADDHATITDVLREVLQTYRDRGREFDTACCLYATAPFITADDLRAGQAVLTGQHRDVVIPVCRYDAPIWRSMARDDDGRLSRNFPDHEFTRSQDLPAAYFDAGHWVWVRVAPFLAGGPLMGANTGSIVLPAERVQDIDTEEDWVRAERKFEEFVS